MNQAHGGIDASSPMACLLFTAQFGLNPELVFYRDSNSHATAGQTGSGP